MENFVELDIIIFIFRSFSVILPGQPSEQNPFHSDRRTWHCLSNRPLPYFPPFSHFWDVIIDFGYLSFRTGSYRRTLSYSFTSYFSVYPLELNVPRPRGRRPECPIMGIVGLCYSCAGVRVSFALLQVVSRKSTPKCRDFNMSFHYGVSGLCRLRSAYYIKDKEGCRSILPVKL